MKKLFLVSALVAVCGVVNAADVVTSYAAPQMVSEINAGFATRDTSDVTNITGLAAFATNIVAVAPVTNLTGLVAFLTNATLTLQYGDVVYGDVTNSLLTNVSITVNAGAVPAIQTGAAATLQKVTPVIQRR